MSPERKSRRDGFWIAAVLSLVAAVAASLVLLLLPVVAVHGKTVVYDTDGTLLTGTIHRDETLVENQGWMVVTALVIPIVFAALPVMAGRRGRFRWMRAVSAVLLTIFVLLTGFSIGLFYLPSALAMIVSAALQ